MAEDEPLRRVVEAARAKAAGTGQFSPGPPADPISAPWLQFGTPGITPPPATNGTPLPPPRVAIPEVQNVTRPLRRSQAGVVAGLPSKHHENAWTLAHRMLKQYGKEMAGNLTRADLHLAQELMENGTLLLRYGVPMDNLGSLIRLARDLAHQGASDTGEDPRIDALRKSMERDEVTAVNDYGPAGGEATGEEEEEELNQDG
jgi:hypothetical protein